MGILDFLSARTVAAPDPEHVADTVRRILDLHPQLRLLRYCEVRLAPPVRSCLAYLAELIGSLPPPREASAAAWSGDPWIHAFFGAPDEVARVVSRSCEVREWFARHPGADEVHAVLGMELHERHALGVAREGDMVRREAPQTSLSFTDHQLPLCTCDEAQLKEEVRGRLLDQLALEALAQIDVDRMRRDRLTEERALLQTRMRLLQLRSSGMYDICGGAPKDSGAEMEKLRFALAINAGELERCGAGDEALAHEFDRVLAVFAEPQRHLSVQMRRFRIDPLNVVVEEANASGADIAIPVARLPTTPPSERAFALVRFARRDLLSRDELPRSAEQLLCQAARP